SGKQDDALSLGQGTLEVLLALEPNQISDGLFGSEPAHGRLDQAGAQRFEMPVEQPLALVAAELWEADFEVAPGDASTSAGDRPHEPSQAFADSELPAKRQPHDHPHPAVDQPYGCAAQRGES